MSQQPPVKSIKMRVAHMPRRMIMKYQAQVKFIGPLATEFLNEGIAVLFNMSAPDELREFAILHDGVELSAEVVAGDTVEIGTEAFKVLAIGPVANGNLADLGHLSLKFNGHHEVEMPGDVCLEAKPMPHITVGTIIRISEGT